MVLPRQYSLGRSSLFLRMTMESGLDETVEERVRRGRTALELRMELRGDEVGVAGQLDDLDELAVR